MNDTDEDASDAEVARMKRCILAYIEEIGKHIDASTGQVLPHDGVSEYLDSALEYIRMEDLYAAENALNNAKGEMKWQKYPP